MGYRIVYGEEPTLGRKSRLGLWTAAFLLVFVAFVRLTWPEGAEQLRTVLKPSGETVEAFSRMVENVGAGQGMEEAVTAFCRSVVSSAQSD